MKRLLFCICLLSIISMTAEGKEKTIKRPPFIAWSCNTIEIDEVTLSDTATVLHIKAFYPPQGWIRITSYSFLRDNNGETYPLRSGIGIVPDTKFRMPESGEAEFDLIFPPLPKSVTSIDFSEGDNVEGAFNIWGIQLQGNKLPKLMLPTPSKQSTPTNDAFATAPLCYNKATLKGRILDFRPGMEEELYINLSEPIKGFVEGPTVKVHSNGSFSLTVAVTGTTPGSFGLFGKQIHFFLVPGQTSEVTINTRELCRQQSQLHKESKPYGQTAFYHGPLSHLAKELNENEIELNLLRDLNKLAQKVGEMDANSYKRYVLAEREETQKEINDASFSALTKQVLSITNDICAAQAIAIAPNIMTQVALRQKEIRPEDEQRYYTKLKEALPADYLNTLKDFSNINTPIAPLSKEFRKAIQTLKNRRNLLSGLWDTTQGAFFDAAQAASIYQHIKEFKPLTERDSTQLDSLPQAYRTFIEKENTKLLKTIEANKRRDGFNINELGEVSNEELFASLISKFREKVILVDFWATWCAPCRKANKAMTPMKKELKDKEIVYLYITGETSPMEIWKNMIPDIHGEHFRLKASQWEYLIKTFRIEGVPTYFIIDREGNIKNKMTGFPGIEKMKEQLVVVSDKW